MSAANKGEKEAARGRPKRKTSQPFSPEQIAFLDEYAAANLDWDKRSVPEDIWASNKFPGFTKSQLAKRIGNYFTLRDENLRTSSLFFFYSSMAYSFQRKFLFQ